MRLIRIVMAGVAGAVGAGILVGVVSRLLMRLVALAAGHEGGFSWLDSVAILMIYAVAMLPGALTAAATTRRLRWVVAAAGCVFLMGPAVGIASGEIGGTQGLSVLQWVALSATSLAVFATIVILPVVTVRIVDRLRGRRRRPRPASPRGSWIEAARDPA
jgi:peptidoglycan/LPS O-acetylase OafA/YrhL